MLKRHHRIKNLNPSLPLIFSAVSFDHGSGFWLLLKRHQSIKGRSNSFVKKTPPIENPNLGNPLCDHEGARLGLSGGFV